MCIHAGQQFLIYDQMVISSLSSFQSIINTACSISTYFCYALDSLKAPSTRINSFNSLSRHLPRGPCPTIQRSALRPATRRQQRKKADSGIAAPGVHVHASSRRGAGATAADCVPQRQPQQPEQQQRQALKQQRPHSSRSVHVPNATATSASLETSTSSVDQSPAPGSSTGASLHRLLRLPVSTCRTISLEPQVSLH